MRLRSGVKREQYVFGCQSMARQSGRFERLINGNMSRGKETGKATPVIKGSRKTQG